MSSHPNLVPAEEARRFRKNVDYLRLVHGMSWDMIAKSIKLERFKNGADAGRRAEMLKDQYQAKPSQEVATAVRQLLDHRERKAIPWRVIERRVLEYLGEHPGARPSYVRREVVGGSGRIFEAMRRLIEKGKIQVEGVWPPRAGAKARTFLYPASREEKPSTYLEKREVPEAQYATTAPGAPEEAQAAAPEAAAIPQDTPAATTPAPDPLEVARQALWAAAESLALSAEQPPAGLRPYLQSAHRETMKRMADEVTDLLAKLE